MHTIFHCGSSPFDHFVEAKVIWQIGLAKFSISPSQPSTQEVILVGFFTNPPTRHILMALSMTCTMRSIPFSLFFAIGKKKK